MKPRLPLRWQFLVVALINLVLLGIVFLVLLRIEMRQELESFLMASAREKIISLSRQFTIDLSASPSEARNNLLERYSENYGFRFFLFGLNGEQLAGSTVELAPEVAQRIRRFGPRGDASAPPPVTPRFLLRAPPFLIVAGRPEQYWIGVRIPLPDTFGAGAIGTLLLQSPTFWSNPFFFEIRPWLTILVVAILVSSLCWLPVVRGLTHAITQMMNATASVAEGDFDVRVNTGRHDELGRLAQSINQMSERLRSYVRGQKRFLGDVAHELRSPLGRMQVAISILEDKAGLDSRTYLADLREEVEAMSALTTELLAFARAEMRPEAVEVVPINLRQVIDRAVEAENGPGAQITVTVDPSLRVRGDEKYLFRAFSNLIRNAVRYAGTQGPISVDATRASGRVEVTVADSGPGVSEEALEKIFEPFFRPEPARDRKTGGTGLGLAIARSSIEACGGAIRCRNRQPHGLVAIVHLNPV